MALLKNMTVILIFLLGLFVQFNDAAESVGSACGYCKYMVDTFKQVRLSFLQ
jgi:hypothetical protein